MQEALDKANLSERDLSAIAATIGPGLSLCLRGMVVFKILFVYFFFIFFVPVSLTEMLAWPPSQGFIEPLHSL